jgi:hypothetical protein
MIVRTHAILKTISITAVVLVVGCEPGDFGPLLDIPISPIGKTRSPPFRLYSDYTYNIAIGLDPMKVDESKCAASLIALNPEIPYPPCHELTPAVGAWSWVVRQDDNVVAQGHMDASPIDVVRGRWSVYGGWFGHPGKDYVIEIDLQPSPEDLAQFHPRLAILKPFK